MTLAFRLSEPEHELGRIGWATVPMCDECYAHHYKKQPIAMLDPEVELCCMCLQLTEAGIYVRGYAQVVNLEIPGQGSWKVYQHYPH